MPFDKNGGLRTDYLVSFRCDVAPVTRTRAAVEGFGVHGVTAFVPRTKSIAALIGKMKRGAYLVNTARGKICDRDAIVRALKRAACRLCRRR